MAIIEVEDVVKEFRLGQQRSLRDTLRDGWARLRGRKPAGGRVLRALDGVSFAVEEGEVVGLIGTNGAGKSTLLKILSRITEPTRGRVTVRGRVAPLIEVGAGLHPELTGRENVYLNASILGVPRRVIRRKVDEIAAFAELERFMDTPVKRYSSGMKIRLGFAIATSVEAEILIVDEVLAVGDLAFQRKCFDRMERLIKDEGRTVLLVSHNIRQVARICSRALLLDQGRLVRDGDAGAIATEYYDHANELIATRKDIAPSEPVCDSTIKLISISVADADWRETRRVRYGEPLRVTLEFETSEDIKGGAILIGTHTTDFVYLTNNSSKDSGLSEFPKGSHKIRAVIEPFPMRHGTYCLKFAVLGSHGEVLFVAENLSPFVVKASGVSVDSGEWRLLETKAQWECESSPLGVAGATSV